ncbi:MAG: dihydroorotase [Bacteroidales bacterium]|nr:dihydroorotase [Bacteroidales bacterium]
MTSQRIFILNASIVNDGRIFIGDVLIENGIIQNISGTVNGGLSCLIRSRDKQINARGKYLFPGVIDDHVHFRDPGLTTKADIFTESRAAVAGGITSFMEMPNTIPKVFTRNLLEKKFKIASKKSLANYSFYIGASNDNLEEILKTNPSEVCGVKLFLGASTGNMLVDDTETLNKLFAKSPLLIAVHCEDEEIIQKNIKNFKDKYGEDVLFSAHPEIRSEEACFRSSSKAVGLAKKYNSRLHLLHLSTAKELELIDNNIPLKDKKITAEVCVHHLIFNNSDYSKLGSLIKWNPAIKTSNDQEKLFEGLLNNTIDLIATDHAPHKLEEKQNTYFNAPSGGPMIQHSLPIMLDFYHEKKICLETIVDKMCHAPANCFKIEKRGFIREGYWADLVILDLDSPWKVNKKNILYKCQWSPVEGRALKSKVTHTFVNGNLVYENGKFDDSIRGQRLRFEISD